MNDVPGSLGSPLPAGPPDWRPSADIIPAMGEENMHRLCRDFYRVIEGSSIRSMFPGDLERSARRLAWFFIGLCGGPPRYREQVGPPRMRARHLPFAIDRAARDEWLRCFEEVLTNAETEYGFPRAHLPGFRQWLSEFSLWMVNR